MHYDVHFSRLQKGHVDPKAAILVRAGEKLATDNEILHHENEGLRKAIIEEKKKSKRGKAMHFYDKCEKEGQALFFNSTKIAQIRQHNADSEQAERQRKLDTEDRKLQFDI